MCLLLTSQAVGINSHGNSRYTKEQWKCISTFSKTSKNILLAKAGHMTEPKAVAVAIVAVVKVAQSCPTLCDTWTIQSMEFSRLEYWSGWPFPSPGDLPDLGIEPRSPALQADSLPTEPPTQGSPEILEWVAYPFSSGSTQPRNRTGIFCIAGGFFTN